MLLACLSFVVARTQSQIDRSIKVKFENAVEKVISYIPLSNDSYSRAMITFDNIYGKKNEIPWESAIDLVNDYKDKVSGVYDIDVLVDVMWTVANLSETRTPHLQWCDYIMFKVKEFNVMKIHNIFKNNHRIAEIDITSLEKVYAYIKHKEQNNVDWINHFDALIFYGGNSVIFVLLLVCGMTGCYALRKV